MSGRKQSYILALGGISAGLSVVIMSLGTVIPVATYVCPMLCALVLHVYLRVCGRRAAWTWYAAVALLSALLAPDKEAAAVFVFFGYYPIVKPLLDRLRPPFLWKLVYFNAATVAMYALLIFVMGMNDLVEEFSALGTVLTLVTLVLGNVTFFLLDRLLAMLTARMGRKSR